MANRNRSAGHIWERLVNNLLKFIYPTIKTSRNESREADNRGIDHCVPGVYFFGFSIQDKNESKRVNYVEVLKEVDGQNPVIFHKYTEKSTTGKFIEKGRYAICYLKLFISMMHSVELLKKAYVFMENAPDELKKEIEENLKNYES